MDGSIIAKAWDYIGLRLPNAYSQYFDIALSNVNLSETEPQAIVDNRVTKTLRWQLLAKKVLGINGTIFRKCARINAAITKYRAKNGRKSATSL